MTQSSCKRDTKFKIHPGMKLALVRVFSCKHPLIQPTARSCRGLSWPRSFGMGFRVLAAAYLGGESVCIKALKRCSRLAEAVNDCCAVFSSAAHRFQSTSEKTPHITDPNFAFYSKALFARLPSVESKHCVCFYAYFYLDMINDKRCSWEECERDSRENWSESLNK